MQTEKNRGFTLVELVVVVVILAVLAALLVPRYVQYVGKAREQVCATNRNELERILGMEMTLRGRKLSDSEIQSLTGYTVISGTLQSDTEHICPSQGVIKISYSSAASVYSLKCSIHGFVNEKYEKALEAAKEAKKNIKNPDSGNSEYRKAYMDYLKTNGLKDFLVDDEIKALAGSGYPLPQNARYLTPYYIKANDGSGRVPVIYVSNGKTATNNGWDAYMVCYDGVWYKSTLSFNNKIQSQTLAGCYDMNESDFQKNSSEYRKVGTGQIRVKSTLHQKRNPAGANAQAGFLLKQFVVAQRKTVVYGQAQKAVQYRSELIPMNGRKAENAVGRMSVSESGETAAGKNSLTSLELLWGNTYLWRVLWNTAKRPESRTLPKG